MDANAKRPWYRLHWGTVLVVFFVGMGWLEYAFFDAIGSLFATETRDYALEGWPFAVGLSGTVDYTLLAIDVGLLVTALVGVAFTVERLERGGLRFSLATLGSFVTVLGMLLAFWRWQQDWDQVYYFALDPYWWTGTFTVLFATGCTFYSAIWLAARIAFSIFSRLRRPAPAKVEADGSPAQ